MAITKTWTSSTRTAKAAHENAKHPWEYPRTVHADGQLTEDPAFLRSAAAINRMTREEVCTLLARAPTPDHFDTILRLRFRHDVEWFIRYCWPDTYTDPFNDFQSWFIGRPKAYYRDRMRTMDRSSLNATAAPRGNAKTTLSKGSMVHDLVYGLEALTIVVSAELQGGSEPIVKAVIEMATQRSEALKRLYGNIIVGTMAGYKWMAVGNNPKIGYAPKSFKTQFRGSNFEERRPTKVLIDDGEHPDRVKNPDNRRADLSYLQDDILKGGPQGGRGMLIEMVGTVLMRDAMLPYLMNKTGWNGRKWRAITTWSEDADSLAAWDQCKAIWSDLHNPSREDDAKAFYLANREVMERGWEVMDPYTWGLYPLHLAMWVEGMPSFLRERQNETRISQTALFDSEKFRYVDVDHIARTVTMTGADGEPIVLRIDDMALTGFLDPIPGKSLGHLDGAMGQGDFGAFAVLAKHASGYVFVLDLWMGKEADSALLNAVWAMCEKWQIQDVGVESFGFQRLVTRDFQRSTSIRRANGHYWRCEFFDYTTTQSKEERIAMLEPVTMVTGWLQFASHLKHHEGMTQFDDFPFGSHDDFPDAVCSGYDRLGGSPIDTTTNFR